MRILFIGEQSVRNDAIIKVIESETDGDIQQTTFDELQSRDGRCFLLILDLLTHARSFEDYIRIVKEENISDFLVAVYDGSSNLNEQSLKEAGADYCFSLDSDPGELVNIISDVNGS